MPLQWLHQTWCLQHCCNILVVGRLVLQADIRAAVSLFCSTEAETKHGVSSTAAALVVATAGLYCRQMSIGATAVAKGCCQPGCSTEADTKHGVSSTAATSWWLVTAGLYCRQMCRCHCSGKRLLSAWSAVLRQTPNTVSPALLQACIAGKCQ